MRRIDAAEDGRSVATMSAMTGEGLRDCQMNGEPAERSRRQLGLRVVECDPRSDRRWQTFLESRRDALVYHHPAWLDVLAREYGQEPIGLACENGEGALRGVLPLFRSRGLPFRLEGQ